MHTFAASLDIVTSALGAQLAAPILVCDQTQVCLLSCSGLHTCLFPDVA